MPPPKRGSLSRSVSFLMALGIAVFGMLQVASMAFIVEREFSRLASRELSGRLSQFDVLLEREESGLASLAQSYAEWSDSYEFMSTRDPAYCETNYGPSWRAALDIGFVAVIAPDGEVLWSAGGGQGRLSAPAFAPGDALVFPRAFGSVPSGHVSGYALSDGVPMLYVSWPISDDLATLEPVGLLVFGRLLGDEAVSAFAPGEEMRVSFLPDGQWPKIDRTGAAIVDMAQVEDDELISYRELFEPSGRPIGAWRFGMERVWRATAFYLILILSIIALAACAGLYVVSYATVSKYAVAPIREIRDYLDAFAATLAPGEPLAFVRDDELGELALHVNDLVSRVHSQTSELDRMACTDGLTGLANRRKLDDFLARQVRPDALPLDHHDLRSPDKQGWVGCAIVDVDYFKRYNDIYGHAAGDEALRRIAEAIGAGVRRPGDLACRYGGEEFVVVLPDTDEEGALVVLERIRASVEALGMPHKGSDAAPVVTVSAGVAAARKSGGFTPEALLAAADRALYVAKNGGRNSCVVDSAETL